MTKIDPFKLAERELAKALRRKHPFLTQEDGSTRDYTRDLRKASQNAQEPHNEHH